MSAKRINPRLVKLHRSYSVEETSRLLNVHKNTVRGWQKRGLEAIDTSRPTLFQGRALRAFLERERAGRKCPCPPGTMYCFRCRTPRPPALGMVDCVPLNSASGNLKAICATCETLMHRRIRLAALDAIMPGIAIQFSEASSRLTGRTAPSLNCDLLTGA